MEFKVKLLEIRSGGKQIIVIDDEYASLMGIHSSDRVKIRYKKKNIHIPSAGDVTAGLFTMLKKAGI